MKAVNSGGEAQSIADLAVVERTPDRMIEVVKTVSYNNTPNGFHKVKKIIIILIRELLSKERSCVHSPFLSVPL